MKILVTAGPTNEPIDPVRFISNRSTGKMGYSIADICRRRGHKVTLVTGPTALAVPGGVKAVKVTTALEMLRKVKLLVRKTDVLIMAAAVSDFRPANVSRFKIKKHGASSILRLAKNPDILKSIRGLKKGRTFIGFAAETNDTMKEAERKLKEKGLDLIVANDVSRKDSGFGVDTNRVVFIMPGGKVKRFPLMTKMEVAGCILDWIEANRGR